MIKIIYKIYLFLSLKIASHKSQSEEGAVPLELANVIGVFYVLSVGSTAAMFLAFIAVVHETWRVCKDNKVRSLLNATEIFLEMTIFLIELIFFYSNDPTKQFNTISANLF